MKAENSSYGAISEAQSWKKLYRGP